MTSLNPRQLSDQELRQLRNRLLLKTVGLHLLLAVTLLAFIWSTQWFWRFLIVGYIIGLFGLFPMTLRANELSMEYHRRFRRLW